MRFSTRQLLLCVTAFAMWLGVIMHGKYTFGTGGAFTNGIFFGISILTALRLILRWKSCSTKDRGIGAIMLLASLAGGMFLNYVYDETGMYRRPYLVRYAAEMRDLIRTDPRFKSVEVSYIEPGPKVWAGLRVAGTVADQESLDELHKRLGDYEEYAGWQVEIEPPPP